MAFVCFTFLNSQKRYAVNVECRVVWGIFFLILCFLSFCNPHIIRMSYEHRITKRNSTWSYACTTIIQCSWWLRTLIIFCTYVMCMYKFSTHFHFSFLLCFEFNVHLQTSISSCATFLPFILNKWNIILVPKRNQERASERFSFWFESTSCCRCCWLFPFPLCARFFCGLFNLEKKDTERSIIQNHNDEGCRRIRTQQLFSKFITFTQTLKKYNHSSDFRPIN